APGRAGVSVTPDAKQAIVPHKAPAPEVWHTVSCSASVPLWGRPIPHPGASLLVTCSRVGCMHHNILSPIGEFLKGRLRHACVPCRIAQFQSIATGIEKIEFPTGEDPVLPMIQLLDLDMPLLKQLARPDEGLRAHRERVMDLRVLDKGVVNRR